MLENPSTFGALVIFAIVASVTPGPNNFMVMASSAAFGVRRTLPHMAGVAAGFAIMIGSVVLGLGAILDAYPLIMTVFRVVGAAWLLWLALQLAIAAFSRASSDATADTKKAVARPLNLIEAAIFQWVNPKAWAMALGASAAYSGIASEPLIRAALMGFTFLAVAPLCLSLWAVAGNGLSALTMSGVSSRVSLLVMAVFVSASAFSVLMDPEQFASLLDAAGEPTSSGNRANLESP